MWLRILFQGGVSCLLILALISGQSPIFGKEAGVAEDGLRLTELQPDKTSLWTDDVPTGGGKSESVKVFMYVYRPAPEKANGAAVVICPGGGYSRLDIEPEGHGIARWLVKHGIAGMVLEYRLPNGRAFVPLLDAQRAIRTIRAKAKEWKVDPAHVGIMGFSAGGHLAASAGTHFDAGDPKATDPIDRLSCRPDFMILVYPMITHGGSSLLGMNPKPELAKLFANDQQVTDRTPPTFLTHAKDDRAVPAEESRIFLKALKAHKVAAEYLELPWGDHEINHFHGPTWDAWQKRALEWLAEQKMIPPVADERRAEPTTTPSASPADQLIGLAKEGTAIQNSFHAELTKAGHDMPRVIAANEKYRADSSAWAARASALLKAHPAEPATFDVILAMSQIHYVDDETVAILREHHFANPKVLSLLNSFSQASPGPRRQFAEDLADKHPDRTVRANATLALGRMDRIYLIDGLKKNPNFGGRLGTPDELRARARRYLQRVVKDYADVKSDEEGATLGELANDELAGLDNAGRLEVGNVAPDIVCENLDAKPLKLIARSGKVTLLVFWGSWCGPCMRLVPHEAALAQKYMGRPFQLYGVNGGDERDVAKKTVLSKKMTWPIFYGGRIRGGLAAVWNVDAWPAVYVIGPDGVICYKGDGDGLEEAVEKAVAEVERRPKQAGRLPWYR